MERGTWNWDGQVVWISGATGSWGKEFCTQLLSFPISKLVCYCRGDHRGEALRKVLNDERVRIHLGDIRDSRTLRRSIDETVTTVIHLAALKRVEAGQSSPEEVERVNIFGTQEVIEACLAQRGNALTLAFYLSTDKAAQPTTFYGATKYAAEQLWLGANRYSPDPHPPVFCAARFGNALGSAGSVLDTWKGQKERGEPLTIFDPNATRFVVSLPHGVRQVLGATIPLCWASEVRLHLPSMPAVSIGGLADAFAPHYPKRAIAGRHREGEKRHEILCPNPERWQSSETARKLSVREIREVLQEIGYIE